MTRQLRRLAVYCGSASPENPRYEELAMEIGEALALRGIGVVYGGGKLGLMGAVAAGALLSGGEVIGVIPEALVAAEVANKACTELHVVQTMHERKKAFTDLSDGFLTLPGGVGTMDELWEAVSWAQLGYHDKPVGLLNPYGFYDGLVAFYHRMGDSGFIRPEHRGILIVDDALDPLLERMASYLPHKPIFRMTADEL
jgi:uncharacterized protein (TIGR00730 family)